jgi:hypothetical protein
LPEKGSPPDTGVDADRPRKPALPAVRHARGRLRLHAQVELPLQLDCETRLDADGSLVTTVDDRQAATTAGVFVAGEATGIGGAALSVTEGTVTGLAATGRAPGPALLRRRAAQRAFAAAMHASFPIRPGWTSWLDDDTVICRCEEVTHADVTTAIVDLQATDPRAVKLYARPGMGLCQGRVCGYATSGLVAHLLQGPPTEADLRGLATRPVAQPITLGALAAADREGGDS